MTDSASYVRGTPDPEDWPSREARIDLDREASVALIEGLREE